jgi:hypothetical protein
VKVIRQIYGDCAFKQKGENLACRLLTTFEETIVGTTPYEIGSHILDGVLGPVPLGLPVPYGLGHKGLGVCIAYVLLPGSISLPVDVADKVHQNGMRTAGIKKQELRQFWRGEGMMQLVQEPRWQAVVHQVPRSKALYNYISEAPG